MLQNKKFSYTKISTNMKIQILKASLFSSFFLLIVSLNAQIITLQGKVVDSKTNTGIPYVNIGFPAYSVGTSANELGGYIIKIPQERMSDTLTFSSIGYITYRIAVKDIRPEMMKTVSLQANSIGLKEVTIKSLDANKIIKAVLKQREKNYNNKAVVMQVFCREVTKEQNTEQCFYQSEGILEVYKSPVHENEDQVRLLKGRKKNLPPAFEKEGQTYPLPMIVNGPTAAVTLDIVKSPQFFLMHIDQFKLVHTGYESINDQLAYIVHFTPKDSSKRIILAQDADFEEGRMYIDTATKALIRADFNLSVRGINASNLDYKFNRSPLELQKRNYIINYTEYQGKYYFKSAIVENTYIYKGNIARISSKIECLVTQINLEKVKRFSLKEQIGSNESLGQNIAHFDDSFWEDFNFIKSTEVENDTSETTISEPEKEAKPLVVQTEKKVKELLSIEYKSSKGVVFFKGSFEEAKKMAAAQNKLVFIDVYTDWCKPCKIMAAEAFENETIADLMNAFFINFKADAEKEGSRIASTYNVRAYPTTLIVNPNGEIIDNQTGYSGVYGFEQHLNSIIKNRLYGNIYLKMSADYAKKQRDFNFLLAYAQLRKKLGLANDILTDALVMETPLDTLLTIPYQQFLFQYTSTLEGKAFEFILKHRDQNLFEAKLKMLIQTNMNVAIKTKDKDHLTKVLAANTRILNDPSVSEESNAAWTLRFHEKASKDKKYHESATLLMTRYYLPQIDNAKKQNNDLILKDYQAKIQQIGLHYADHIKDKKLLEQMAVLINKACEAHECSELLSVYSQLLYRLKETEKAKELMKKAVALSGNSKDLLDILEKMNSGAY